MMNGFTQSSYPASNSCPPMRITKLFFRKSNILIDRFGIIQGSMKSVAKLQNPVESRKLLPQIILWGFSLSNFFVLMKKYPFGYGIRAEVIINLWRKKVQI